MHIKLGAGLLHGHDALEDGTVLFHELQSLEFDIFVPRAHSTIDMDRILPSSWLLNQNGLFQAFEYDASGETTQLDPAFASDVAEFLKAHRLEKRISIIPNPAEREDSIEFTDPSGCGTISVPLRLISEQNIETGEPAITGWSFYVGLLSAKRIMSVSL